MSQEYPLVAILGPTASGKSALALVLAERWGGEIINYDSVQVYRGLDIGAGKVRPEERRGVPHHLIDIAEPHQTFTAGDYRREALHALESVRSRENLPILVGGTGLYLRALFEGLFEGPKRSEALRVRLRGIAERRGREHLHKLLGRLDPVAALRIAPRDIQKVIRAVEVCLMGQVPISQLQSQGRMGLRGYRVIKIGLDPERSQLAERINRRVECMFAQGLLEETRELVAREALSPIKPLEALGYRQANQVLKGKISLQEAVQMTQVSTRRYAKRQRTWNRRETEVTWFAGFGDDPEIQQRVIEWLQAVEAVAARNENHEPATLVP